MFEKRKFFFNYPNYLFFFFILFCFVSMFRYPQCCISKNKIGRSIWCLNYINEMTGIT